MIIDNGMKVVLSEKRSVKCLLILSTAEIVNNNNLGSGLLDFDASKCTYFFVLIFFF